jgi:hypothetical protein
MIAANNSWFLAYDNLSHVPPWLSDAFCRLSTGGGFATRELFTDQDEVIFTSQRPVLLTSIEEVTTRSDLLDRSMIIQLPAIPEEQRRSEAELFEAFDRVRPRILGALLDAVAVALTHLPSINLPALPRMADFASWATAAESSFGWPRGTFMDAYKCNRESANDVALEASVVAGPLLDFLESQGDWIGSSGELLKLLEERVGDQIRRLSGWPKKPQSLSGHLKRLAPNLRQAGWDVEKQDRTSQKRPWAIRRLVDDATAHHAGSSSSSASQAEGSKSAQSDANWCRQVRDDGDDANDANAGAWNPDRY